MSKLKLLLAVAALAGLVFAGVSVNRLGSDASVTTQPDAGMHATVVPAANTAEKQVVLRGLGMTWLLCKGTVERRLGRVPGVTSYTVEVNTDSATVIYDANMVTAAQIAQAVAEAGYQAREIVEVN